MKTDENSQYEFPVTIQAHRELYPKVQISIPHGTTAEIIAMLSSGEADIGIYDETVEIPDIAIFHYYRWSYNITIPNSHFNVDTENITLDKLNFTYYLP